MRNKPEHRTLRKGEKARILTTEVAGISTHQKLFQRLFLVNFLISLGFGISDAFFSLYCQSIGGRGLLLGVVVGGYALSKIIFSPIMGHLADRIGRRALVLSSLLLYLLVSCAYLSMKQLEIVVCLRLLQGASCAMFRPAVQALIADSTTNKKRGKIMGSFDISFYAALAIAPIIGGFIIDNSGFNGLFFMLILCSLLAFGIALITIPPQPALSALQDRRKMQFKPILFFRKGGTLPGLLLFIFGRACGITVCATFLPILLTSSLGLNAAQTGIIMASSTLVMTALLRPAGRLSDKMSRRKLVVCGGTIVSLLYMLLPLAADFTQVLAITLAIGAFSALSQPAVSALLAEEGQQAGMGSSVGAFHAFLNLGFVVGPLMGSILQESAGMTGVFITIGLLGLSSILGFTLSTSLAVPLRHRPPPEYEHVWAQSYYRLGGVSRKK